MIQPSLNDLEKPWLADEKGGYLGGVEPAKRAHLLRDAPKQLVSKLLSSTSRQGIYRRTKRIGYGLLPSPLRAYIWNETQPKGKVFPTTYLNGMRGIAAIKVFAFHFLHFYTDHTFVPYGRDAAHSLFLDLPVVQFLYAGTTAQVFFVVAGYLMTLQLVALFDKHDQASRAKAFLNISGNLFRRVSRLYLPVFVMTLISAHYIYFGFYEYQRNLYAQRDRYFPGPFTEPWPQQYSSYLSQLNDWRDDMWKLMNFWAHSYRPRHDVHLWSILVEMQGSLVLYLTLLATAQCHKYVRLVMVCGMTCVTLLWDHGETWMYVGGASVALIDLLLTERQTEKAIQLPATQTAPMALPTVPTMSTIRIRYQHVLVSHFKDAPTTAITTIRFLLHIAAFWTISYPMWGYSYSGFESIAPGYETLNSFIPAAMEQKERFWPCVGTMIFLLLLARADPETSIWRQIFNSDLAQYLGKVSFGVYLVQGPLLHAFIYLVPHWVWWSMGAEGISASNTVWTMGIAVGWVVGLVVVLWAGDVWQREVEMRTVKVAQRFEKWCFVKAA